MANLFWTEKEGVLIARLVVPGPLSQEDLDDIAQELKESPERSGGKILLDFRGVAYIPSLLLAKLITFEKDCTASRTDLRLCNLNPLIMEVFKFSRLDTIFEIHSSEQEAMAAF